MTEAHLKDGSRITPEARRVAERVFASLHKLNEDTRSLMISSGDAHLIKLARHSREMSIQKSPPCSPRFSRAP